MNGFRHTVEIKTLDAEALIGFLYHLFRESDAPPMIAAQLAVDLVMRELFVTYTLSALDGRVQHRLEALNDLLEQTEDLLIAYRKRLRFCFNSMMACCGLFALWNLASFLRGWMF